MSSKLSNLKPAPATAPPNITPLDHFISQNGGTTSAIDMLPHQLQRSKVRPTIQERIEELTRENGRLRQELALHNETYTATIALYTKAQEAFTILQDALRNISEKRTMSEKSLLDYWGISTEDFYPEIAIL